MPANEQGDFSNNKKKGEKEDRTEVKGKAKNVRTRGFNSPSALEFEVSPLEGPDSVTVAGAIRLEVLVALGTDPYSPPCSSRSSAIMLFFVFFGS